MQSRTKIIIGIIASVVVIIGLVVYFYFPKIWGNILYPLEYQEYIVKYAKEYDLDPAFLAAVIYSESRFNIDAVSRVGARGLMQIMPSTGKSIADHLGNTNFDVSQLHDPETSIKYGAWYLRDLLNRYNNDEEAALAGYNGGPAVANRYIISRSDASIPHETSGYLKTVMGAKAKYQEIYYQELYTQGVSAENVTEKLKVEQEQQQKTWWQQIVETVKVMVQ
jgi:soluble lytic murein transglycosylase